MGSPNTQTALLTFHNGSSVPGRASRIGVSYLHSKELFYSPTLATTRKAPIFPPGQIFNFVPDVSAHRYESANRRRPRVFQSRLTTKRRVSQSDDSTLLLGGSQTLHSTPFSYRLLVYTESTSTNTGVSGELTKPEMTLYRGESPQTVIGASTFLSKGFFPAKITPFSSTDRV